MYTALLIRPRAHCLRLIKFEAVLAIFACTVAMHRYRCGINLRQSEGKDIIVALRQSFMALVLLYAALLDEYCWTHVLSHSGSQHSSHDSTRASKHTPSGEVYSAFEAP